MSKKSLFLFFLFELLFSLRAFGYTSSKLTFSTGFYEDQQKQDHSVVYFDWYFKNVSNNGNGINLNVGFNNNLIQDQWGLYPYQASYTFALSEPLTDAPFLNSFVSVGRISLIEAPQMPLVDGVHAKIYWDVWRKLNLYAGAVTYLEQTDEMNFDSHLYGGDYSFGKKDLNFRVGYQGGLRDQLWKHYSYGSFYWKPVAPWSWRMIGNGKYNHSENKNADLLLRNQFNLSSSLLLSFTHRESEPDGHILIGRQQIYKIFAAGQEVSNLVAFSWDLDTSTINVSGARNTYASKSTNEYGEEYNMSWDFPFDKHFISPTFLYLHSYGGILLSYGLRYDYRFSDQTTLKMDMEVSEFKKINGIENTAYHFRSGVETDLMQDLRLLARVELERNHIFNFDGRAIVYASYFYY